MATGSYLVRTYRASSYVDEVYSDVSCLCGCDVTTGTPIAVVLGSTTTGIDLALDPVTSGCPTQIDPYAGNSQSAAAGTRSPPPPR